MGARYPTGENWSVDELKLIVASYMEMLVAELSGRPYNKAEYNRRLQDATGRSRGSIEFKHHNISAVMQQIELPWIDGYKPLSHIQKALVDAVEAMLPPALEQFSSELPAASGLSESPAIFIDEPPDLRSGRVVDPQVERLVRKFDPAVRDARNRQLGRAGEERVFRHEIARLRSIGREDLSRKVEWTSEERGDGAGYDIASYTADGQPRLIEVKTTTGSAQTPFFISSNELEVSRERPEAFRLFRLYDFRKMPQAFELAPPLEEAVVLRPSVYRAGFARSASPT